ncbi:MAG: hypothetical protein NTW29_14890 [Bacteroidetes bacterium]|nr:hypothetical protein [Bacteroidota bacterium]
MVVYGTCEFYDNLDKTFFAAKYLGGLIYHFQDLDFGEGVREIVYYSVSSNQPFLNFLEEKDFKPKYGRRNKGISTYAVFDNNLADDLNEPDLLLFLSGHIMEETKKFADFNFRKFNLDAYTISLQQYFDNACQLINDGRDPSEGKKLNEDIEQTMLRKWRNL